MNDPPSQLNAYLSYVTRQQMSILAHIGPNLRFVIGWSAESERALYGPPMPLASTPPRLLEQMRDCYRVLQEAGDSESNREGLYVFLLSREWADAFEAIGARVFPTPEDDNYIYRAKDIGTLDGRCWKTLRHSVRQFGREFGEIEEHDLAEGRASDAKSVVQGWAQQKIDRLRRHPEGSLNFYRNLRDDHHAAIESLRELSNIPLTGKIYYLNGEPVGYISGFPLTDDAYLVLNQKNFRLRGLSETIFHRFARSLMDRYAFLNGGSDAGIASLRFRKEHLGPCRILKTYGAFVTRGLLDSRRHHGIHIGTSPAPN